MGTYESYQDYKNSKNNWIGNVPTHWNIQRADFLIQTNRRQVSAESLDGVELIHYSIPNVQEFGTGKLENGDQIDSAKLLISEQQLLVSKLNPRKSTLCIAVPNDQYTVVASSEFVPLLAGKTHLEYSYYVWGSDKVTKLLSSMVQSVTRSHQRVNPSDILKIYWAWPPIHEQKAIARFLDHKTTQIDALIAKKQSLLDKLAEQRTALISQAVTKGLDPSVATRDSGAAWLGEIPAHWTTSRVKFVAKVGNGSTPSRDNPDYWFDGDFPWLNSSVVNREVVDSADQFVTGVALKECHLPIIEPPAVLVGITGQGKTRGMSSKLTFRATINQHLVYVKPHADAINVDYLHHIFERAYAYLRNESDAGGSTKGAITCSQIENLAIPLPPLAEQEQIVRFVDEDYSRISRLQKKVKAALQRLQEYRAALITNAVTGKIDVRNFCPTITTEQKELAHG